MISLLYKKHIVNRALSHLKIGKPNVSPSSWIKKPGYGVAIMIKSDIKISLGTIS